MPKAEQSLNDLLHEIRRIEQSREVLTEKKIRKIYKQLLKELNHFLADEYLKYSKDGILTVAMLQEKSRYAKFLEEIESHVNNLTPEIVALIKNTVEDTYTTCYKGMSESVLKAKDTKSALNYLKDLNIRPEVMKRAIENPVSGLTLPDILEKNRKEVIYDIKQQVNIGLMNGDRYETTAKKVAERLDISYGKATNIVRTETHRVTESGFMDCAKDISDSLDGSGLVYTAAWRTMKDERVRPQHRYRTKSGWKTSISRNGANHQKMEGVIIQVGDKFQIEPNVYAECPSTSGTARNDCRCRCFLEYTLMSVEKFEELTGKSVDKSGGSGIIKVDKSKLSAYIGKPITENDNQHVREWYYANVNDIPNQIDKTKSFEEQVKQAFELRNKYKHEARVAMADEETANLLELKRPAPTFEKLLKDKMNRKSMSKEEALRDILETAAKTNSDVNKEFGL